MIDGTVQYIMGIFYCVRIIQVHRYITLQNITNIYIYTYYYYIYIYINDMICTFVHLNL
jgi:hypothetical protein